MRRSPKVSVLIRSVPSTRRSVSMLLSESWYRPWAARTDCVSNCSSRAWAFRRSGRWLSCVSWRRSDGVALSMIVWAMFSGSWGKSLSSRATSGEGAGAGLGAVVARRCRVSLSRGGGGAFSTCMRRNSPSSVPLISRICSSCSSLKPSVLWPRRRIRVGPSHARGFSVSQTQAPWLLWRRVGA